MAVATIKVKMPASIAKMMIDGTNVAADASGFATIPQKLKGAALAAGCTEPHDIGTTSQRPTINTAPGQFYFDATLNRPIWRNAANTAWVFSDGTAA